MLLDSMMNFFTKSRNKAMKIDSIYAKFQMFIGASKFASVTGNQSQNGLSSKVWTTLGPMV